MNEVTYATRCYFCCALPTVEIYECPDVAAVLPGGVHIFRGAWYGCRTCRLLIDTGAWTHLVAHVTAAFLSADESLDRAQTFEIAWTSIDAFRRGRESLA